METKLSIRLSATLSDLIRLLPLGEVFLGDGREPFTVTEASIAKILAAWAGRGNEMVIDYEHQTVQGGEAPAAGWVKELAAREDGLWARVEWTDRAKRYIQNKEYRYFSPVVMLGDDREVTDLLHAALTNLPAIRNLPPLTAKQQQAAAIKGERKMLTGLKQMLGVQDDNEIVPCISLMLDNRRRNREKLAAILELEGDEVTQARIEGAVLALKTDRDRYRADAEELAVLKREQGQAEFERLFSDGLASGKIEPAKEAKVREHVGGSFEMLRSYLECATPGVPVKRLGAAPAGQPNPAALTPDEMQMCRALNIAPEKFKATRQLLAGEAEEVL